MKKTNRRRRTKRSRMNPHDRNEIGTIEKKHNRKEANNMVNTQHINKTWCTTKQDAWQRIYEATHGKRWCVREHHIKTSLNEPKQHITILVSPHMQISKLVQIWITHYIEVVKQQVNMHHDDLLVFSNQATYKVHLIWSYDLENMSKTSQTWHWCKMHSNTKQTLSKQGFNITWCNYMQF